MRRIIIYLISLLLNPYETIRSICSLEPAYQPYLKFGSPPFFLAMASVKMRKARDLALVVIAFGDFLRIVTIVVALAIVALKPERKHVFLAVKQKLEKKVKLLKNHSHPNIVGRDNQPGDDMLGAGAVKTNPTDRFNSASPEKIPDGDNAGML
ncbi:hypothetical protein HID58_004253 [Brassica napus]|uniref:Uncharacterized protein n=1 Tax=Brassica napus TaxID=3708 RepID=A0ABQ8E592_BRANA|nr:hypothetical protein HID58_004253 [Brassica napus]